MIDRSAVGVIEVVSVATLSAGFWSLTPAGASMRAELTTTPVVAVTDVVMVKVAVAPTASPTVVLMLPLPDGAHDAPTDGAHVHDAAPRPAGRVSTTGAATTADGPALATTIVYVMASPGWALTRPSVLVIDRSASGFNVSVSVAVLLPATGSVTPLGAAMVTVLARVDEAAGDTVASIVNVAVPPTARSMLAAMLPVPLAGQLPPVAVHVQVAPSSAAGSRSVTVAPATADGPALPATTVYVTGVPGTTFGCPSVLVTNRSARSVSVSVSVAVLLLRSGSVEPAGEVIDAVLTRVPVAAAPSVAVIE